VKYSAVHSKKFHFKFKNLNIRKIYMLQIELKMKENSKSIIS